MPKSACILALFLWSTLWRPWGTEVMAEEVAVPPSANTPASVEEFALRDSSGAEFRLDGLLSSSEFIVMAFTGVECPLARLYASRLQEIADEYASHGVQVIGINSNSQDTPTEVLAFARRHDIQFPMLKDVANRVADQLQITRTPEVVVVDRDRRVRYRGRIDDQYVVGVVRNQPTRQDLREALDALVGGESVEVSVTEPIGCLIGRVRQPQPDAAVTYSQQVSRILQKRCVHCHRAGDIGPFELTEYEEVAGWGDMMLEVIEQRRMPPWHADPEFGAFRNDASMPPEEMAVIREWVEHGCPEGDPSLLPEPIDYVDGWQMERAPDEVIAMRETPFTVPATAGKEGVPYQYFTVKTDFEEERWVRAAEVRPGNKSVVHHIIVYATPSGERSRKQWIFLTAYVPGLRYEPFPPGAAKRIPAGATLIFEMHYTPIGSPQEDVSSLGLVFADPAEVTHEVLTADITNHEFQIPPHAPDHGVTVTSRPIPRDDAKLWSLAPHMHLRGKSFRYDLVEKDGTRTTLLNVPEYDFNWQTSYVLQEPLTLPRDAVIHCRAAFDNSSSNLANPDPDQSVTWGEQSWDEMMIGFCDVIIPVQEPRRPAFKILRAGPDVVGLFDRCDANGDNVVSRDEAEQIEFVREAFPQVDTDKNGRIEMAEAVRSMSRPDGPTD
jgi:peroxiredoxin